jgi:ADP-heptose:LPS heptosyltransferase
MSGLHKEWHEVHRLAVTWVGNQSGLGTLEPVLDVLTRVLPDAQITLLAAFCEEIQPLLPRVAGRLVELPGETGLLAKSRESGATRLGTAGEERALIESLRAGKFDAAIIFSGVHQSPYLPAYRCYLAGIPIRAGHSKEFGGGVLSHRARPPADDTPLLQRHLSLLQSIGLDISSEVRRMSRLTDLMSEGPGAKSWDAGGNEIMKERHK